MFRTSNASRHQTSSTTLLGKHLLRRRKRLVGTTTNNINSTSLMRNDGHRSIMNRSEDELEQQHNSLASTTTSTSFQATRAFSETLAILAERTVFENNQQRHRLESSLRQQQQQQQKSNARFVTDDLFFLLNNNNNVSPSSNEFLTASSSTNRATNNHPKTFAQLSQFFSRKHLHEHQQQNSSSDQQQQQQQFPHQRLHSVIPSIIHDERFLQKELFNNNAQHQKRYEIDQEDDDDVEAYNDHLHHHHFEKNNNNYNHSNYQQRDFESSEELFGNNNINNAEKTNKFPLLFWIRSLMASTSDQLSLVPNVGCLSVLEQKSLEKIGSQLLKLLEEKEKQDLLLLQQPQESSSTFALMYQNQKHAVEATNIRIASELYDRLEENCCLTKTPLLAKALVNICCCSSDSFLRDGGATTACAVMAKNSMYYSNALLMMMKHVSDDRQQQQHLRKDLKNIHETQHQQQQDGLLEKNQQQSVESNNNNRNDVDETQKQLVQLSMNMINLTPEERKQREVNRRALEKIRREKLQKLVQQQLQEEKSLRSHNNEVEKVAATRTGPVFSSTNISSSISSSSQHHHQMKREKQQHEFLVKQQALKAEEMLSITKQKNQDSPAPPTTITQQQQQQQNQIQVQHRYTPFFVKQIGECESFNQVSGLFFLFETDHHHLHQHNKDYNNNNNNHFDQQHKSLVNSFENGSRFLPLDAITIFASKYDCFVNNTKTTHLHANIENGKRLVRKFTTLQTAAVNRYFASSQQQGNSQQQQQQHSELSTTTDNKNVNVEAATEVSLIITDMLLKHCEAPTLATQLLNSSRPVFESYLPTMSTDEQKNKFKSKLASLRIRAACSQHPPQWKLALDQTKSLFPCSPQNQQRQQKSQTRQQQQCNYRDDNFAALRVFLASIPPHSLKPDQWLEFAVKFFPVPTVDETSKQAPATTAAAAFEEFVEDYEAEIDEISREGKSHEKNPEQEESLPLSLGTTTLFGVAKESSKKRVSNFKIENKKIQQLQLQQSSSSLLVEEENNNNNHNNNNNVFAPSAVFHQLCRVFIRSVEVHHSRSLAIISSSSSSTQSKDKNLQQQTDDALKSLTEFANVYYAHLVVAPHVATLVLTSLVSIIEIKRFTAQDEEKNIDDNFVRRGKLVQRAPTDLQREAVKCATNLLGPLLLQAAAASSSSSSSSSSSFQPSRSLTMTISALVSKCGLVGMWSDALSILSASSHHFEGTRRIADARTWSCVAHIAHRPRPANWVASLIATKHALGVLDVSGAGISQEQQKRSLSTSSSSCYAGDLEDVTEAATATLISLAHSDLAYSKRSQLALQVFTRARALRNGDDEPGTTKRMIAAAVDALTMRLPSEKVRKIKTVLQHDETEEATPTSSSMANGLWAQASEIFGNFVATRAVDVTSASRWLRNNRNSYNNDHNQNNQKTPHQITAADAAWRGRFAGKGRLGDEQRLASSLVRALSSSSSSQQQTQSDNLNSALMLCGGDGPALLRAAAESGAWLCALSTLNSLLTTHSRAASLFEKRKWIENAALACLWAPNVGAYLGLQRVFPNAILPPISNEDNNNNEDNENLTSSTSSSSNKEVVKKSYISCEQEDPHCDESRFVHLQQQQQQQQQEAEDIENEKRKQREEMKAKLVMFSRLDEALGKRNQEEQRHQQKTLEETNDNNSNNNNFMWSPRRRFNRTTVAKTRTVASFEKQEIIDLSEKIFLMMMSSK